MSELGLMGLTVPEEFGGAGHGQPGPVRWSSRRSTVRCASTGVTLSVHNSLVGAPLNAVMAATRAEGLIGCLSMASGDTLGAYCLTEANAGSDAGFACDDGDARRRRLGS